MSGFVIPDIDIWVRGLSRLHPDPKVVHRLSEHVKKREVILANAVRHAVLARTQDDRQLVRLNEAFTGFPELSPPPDDIARLVQRMRAKSLDLPIATAVLWSLARRVRGKIWSSDPGWRVWQQNDCPVIN